MVTPIGCMTSLLEALYLLLSTIVDTDVIVAVKATAVVSSVRTLYRALLRVLVGGLFTNNLLSGFTRKHPVSSYSVTFPRAWLRLSTTGVSVLLRIKT